MPYLFLDSWYTFSGSTCVTIGTVLPINIEFDLTISTINPSLRSENDLIFPTGYPPQCSTYILSLWSLKKIKLEYSHNRRVFRRRP